MIYYALVLFSVLGLFIGSFLNVVIYRYNTGKSAMTGRSMCLTCGKQLHWYENIPVVSFLFLRGRCSGCGTHISCQYPLVEISSAVLFALVFVRQYVLYTTLYSTYAHGLLYSSILLFFYFSIVSILLIIAVYDMRHKIIPNEFVFWFIGLSAIKLIVFYLFCFPIISGGSFLSTSFHFPYIMDLFAPLILFTPFWLLWVVSQGRWIGFGDAKLAVGIGALLGFVYGLSAIVLGFWIGAAVCLLLLVIQRIFPGIFHLTAGSEVPLGPFLILGVCIVFFTHVDVLGISQFFGM